MELGNVSDFGNTTIAYPINSQGMETTNTYHDTIRILQRYVIPIIIITGCFGNSLCFVVLIASNLRRISTSVYLAALAFSDTGFLVCLAISWIESLGIRYFHSEGICQLTVFCSYVFSFTSVWFVNAFTTDMYVAVFHPQKRQRLCLPDTAKKIVCGLSVSACVLYSFVFWTTKVIPLPSTPYKICMTALGGQKTAMILSNIDTVITLVIPFSSILFMTTRLFLHLTKYYRTEMENNGTSATNDRSLAHAEHLPSTTRNNQNTLQQANDAQNKLTRMLVATVVVFLFFNLPSHAIKFQFLIRSYVSDTILFTETESLVQVIFQMLYYANFSVNFILYMVCGRSFRSELLQLFFNCKNKYTCCKNGFCCWNLMGTIWGAREQRSASNYPLRNQEHSRFVDIDLQEIRFSQLPSVDTTTPLKSPPCLLRFDNS